MPKIGNRYSVPIYEYSVGNFKFAKTIKILRNFYFYYYFSSFLDGAALLTRSMAPVCQFLRPSGPTYC